MQVNSVNRTSYQPTGGADDANKMKQLFQKLGTALESGNQADAKTALAQIQKNAPAQAGQGSNPIGDKVAAISKAVESGDMKAAKSSFTELKAVIAQGPPQGGARPAEGGQRAGGHGSGHGGGGAKKAESSSGSSSSNTTYDKKDINKDGTVSASEELQYALQHPEETQKATATISKDAKLGGKVDLFA